MVMSVVNNPAVHNRTDLPTSLRQVGAALMEGVMVVGSKGTMVKLAPVPIGTKVFVPTITMVPTDTVVVKVEPEGSVMRLSVDVAVGTAREVDTGVVVARAVVAEAPLLIGWGVKKGTVLVVVVVICVKENTLVGLL